MLHVNIIENREDNVLVEYLGQKYLITNGGRNANGKSVYHLLPTVGGRVVHKRLHSNNVIVKDIMLALEG